MYLELEELYNMKIIQSKFNEEILLEQLLNNPHVTSQIAKIKKGTHFPTDSVSQDNVYFLKKGIAGLHYNERLVVIADQKDFIGLDDLLAKEAPKYTIEVLEECEVIVFERHEIMDFIFSMQEGWLYLYLNEKKHHEILIEKVKFLRERGIDRLAHTYYDLANRFGEPTKDGKIIPKCFNLRRLAEIANISANSVASFNEVLKERGLLVKKGTDCIVTHKIEK
ncbi:Crp/Fnr family transcriptional regulator [Listeria booriae]|uniref:Crp/Fnr family transcriptional regulator n=1 Tax=Listeria booriae TaxID=1552123 RepID=A0A7X1D6X0_9LIST|nr:Crp/Fnr family transcriptional regulator [Listeria booriae]MBC2168248.1 Crp/Fnr family transcriptional regulator [Listeria booriae]